MKYSVRDMWPGTINSTSTVLTDAITEPLVMSAY